jgi:hypothetical protein
MSNKPAPAFIAQRSVDLDEVRKDIRLTFDLAKQNNVNLELILKNISTVHCESERLTKWAEIAMEEVQNFLIYIY